MQNECKCATCIFKNLTEVWFCSPLHYFVSIKFGNERTWQLSSPWLMQTHFTTYDSSVRDLFSSFGFHVNKINLRTDKIKWGWLRACVPACVRACVGYVCLRLLSCRSGTAHADRSLWRGAPHERELARASRDERGAKGGGRSREWAQRAHRHAGIMEKTSPLRGTLSSNGLRLLTSLLTLYGLTSELTASLSFCPCYFRGHWKKLQWGCPECLSLVTDSKRQNRTVFVVSKWAVFLSKPASFI